MLVCGAGSGDGWRGGGGGFVKGECAPPLGYCTPPLHERTYANLASRAATQTPDTVRAPKH